MKHFLMTALCSVVVAASGISSDAANETPPSNRGTGEADSAVIHVSSGTVVSLFDSPHHIRDALGEPVDEGLIPEWPDLRFLEYEGLFIEIPVGSPWPFAIVITGTAFRTARGLTIGATRSEIENAYGRPVDVIEGGPTYMFSRPNDDHPTQKTTEYLIRFAMGTEGTAERIVLNFNVQ